MPISVVLDTNFLLLLFEKKIDLEVEIERLLGEPHFFVVLKQCIDELQEMAKHSRKFSLASKGVIALIEKKKFKTETHFQGAPDDAMLEYCVAENAVLCTLDADLRRKAKKLRVKTIFLRGNSHLAM